MVLGIFANMTTVKPQVSLEPTAVFSSFNRRGLSKLCVRGFLASFSNHLLHMEGGLSDKLSGFLFKDGFVFMKHTQEK